MSSKQFAIGCLQQCFDAHTQTDPASTLAVSLEILGCARGCTCMVVSSERLRTLKVAGMHCWLCLVCLWVIAWNRCACVSSSVHANQWHTAVASFCLHFWRLSFNGSELVAHTQVHQIMHTQMPVCASGTQVPQSSAPCRTQHGQLCRPTAEFVLLYRTLLRLLRPTLLLRICF